MTSKRHKIMTCCAAVAVQMNKSIKRQHTHTLTQGQRRNQSIDTCLSLDRTKTKSSDYWGPLGSSTETLTGTPDPSLKGPTVKYVGYEDTVFYDRCMTRINSTLLTRISVQSSSTVQSACPRACVTWSQSSAAAEESISLRARR